MNDKDILLHVCCAPCSAGIVKSLLKEGCRPFLFFYNPNVFPKDEYEIRKEAVKAFALKVKVPFIDCDYDPENWLSRIKGHENEPERGQRCALCFDMRLERCALYASEHGYKVFSSTNGIAIWKDFTQVTNSGLKAASRYKDLAYLPRDWRKNDGIKLMYTTAKREHFYKQQYCGCLFSLQKTNLARQKKGLPPVSSDSPQYY